MPAPTVPTRRVAVYWDFDNVVLSRYDAVHGRNSWSQERYSKRHRAAGAGERMREARVDLGVVMDYAATLGSVVINRAYADWTPWWMTDYQRDLLEHAVDLVQLFPLSGTKNGADIRLAVDVVEDLHHHPDLSDVIVVAGDSDYVGLAQRCRRNGRAFVGVGIRDHTSPYLVAASNEFKFYDVLANESAAAPDEDTSTPDPARARELLVKALEQLLTTSTSGWVKRVLVKPMMLRLDPGFDQREYGHETFTGFLDAHEPDVIEHREVAGSDREYRFTAKATAAEVAVVAPEETAEAPVEPGTDYARDLRATRVVLGGDRRVLWRTLHELPRLIGGRSFPGSRELQAALAEHVTPADATDVVVAAFRVGRVFRRDGLGHRLREDLGGEDIRRRVALGMADRIRQSRGHALDEEELVAVMFGSHPYDVDRHLAHEVLHTPTIASYQEHVAGLLPGGALEAVLVALAALPGPAIGTAVEVRDHLVAAAENAGFTLTADDGGPLWDLLYESGILAGEDTEVVERPLPGEVRCLLDAMLDVVRQRIADAGLPVDHAVLMAATGLPGPTPSTVPIPATVFDVRRPTG